MYIVVCVKQTPDTAATLTVDDGKPSWGEAPLVLNPWDEYAVEQALVTQEAEGGQVTVICLGPDTAEEALKHALAMGCDEAILIHDPLFDSADSLVASRVLVAGIQKLESVDLVFFGKSAVDTDTGVMGSQVARRLGWPSLNLVAAISELDAGAKTITVERLLEEGRQVVSRPTACSRERGEGDQRAEVSLLHGNSQGLQSRNPPMVGVRYWAGRGCSAGADLARDPGARERRDRVRNY